MPLYSMFGLSRGRSKSRYTVKDDKDKLLEDEEDGERGRAVRTSSLSPRKQRRATSPIPQHHRKQKSGSGGSRSSSRRSRSVNSLKDKRDDSKSKRGREPSSMRSRYTSTSSSVRRSKAKSRSSKRSSLRVSVADFMCKTNEAFKDKYILGDVLYEGDFCRIHACTHKLTNSERVVKVVYENGTNPLVGRGEMDDSTEEMEADFSLNHHNAAITTNAEFEVMRKLDTSFAPKVFKMYDQDGHHMIVMERCYGNNLQAEMSHRGSALDEATVKQIMWQIISCLNYLHESAHVVHCDLRPCNILLDQPHDFSKIKVIDFDEAVPVEDPNEKVREKRGLGKGVDCIYQAPELHGKRPKFNSKADMWTCGILMYHLLYRRYPFISEHSIRGANTKDTARDVIRRMNKSKLKFPKREDLDVSSDAKDLIASLLHPKYKRRPSAAKVLTHKWFAKEYGTSQMSSRTLDTALPDPNIKLNRMMRLANLRKHNPDSRLKQAVCAIIAAELLTKEEHAKVDAVFQQLDILKDGKLRPNEVKAAFLLSMGVQLSDDDIDDIFRKCDNNRNGSLDFSEFAVASMDDRDLMSDARLRQVFQRFDRHKRGFISKAELRSIPAFAQHSEEELEFVIAEVDIRGKGQIDYNSFVQLMRAGTVY